MKSKYIFFLLLIGFVTCLILIACIIFHKIKTLHTKENLIINSFWNGYIPNNANTRNFLVYFFLCNNIQYNPKWSASISMNDHKKNVSFEQFSKQIQLALNNFKHTHLQDSLLEEIKEMVSQILVYRLYHNEKIISKNFKKDLDMLGVEWEEIDLNYNNKEDLRTLSKILGYPANEMNSVDVQIEIDDFIQNNKNLEVIISNFPL